MVPPTWRSCHSVQILFFGGSVALTQNVPKKSKAVILLSTMRSDTAVNDDEKKKSKIILSYNKYKAGVDTMDQMITRYTTQRHTQRWPVVMFFNMLDISLLASYFLYYMNNNMLPKKTNQQRLFMRQMSEELAKPMIENGYSNKQVMRNHSYTIAIESFFQIGPLFVGENQELDSAPRDQTGRKKIIGSCYICYRQAIKKRRKTRKSCDECEKPVCDKHSKQFRKCIECNG